jgi:hypothetical protein
VSELGAYWVGTGFNPPIRPFPVVSRPLYPPLPAVVLAASRQMEKVERLVEYCRKLDGTEITVLPLPPEIDQVPHPVGTEMAVRYGAKIFSNTPWIYLEADSIPLWSSWRHEITHEYHTSKKLFMLPSLDGLSPFDVAAAIGVWPAGTAELLPTKFQDPPWFDLWVYQNRAADLHLTRKIQHSYGLYEGHRVIRRWEFPGDRHIIRADAAIFHADPSQSIIRGGLTQTFYSSGDLGDIVAALPILKQQGGGRLYLGPGHSQPNTRELMTQARFDSIRSLLESQYYITETRFLPQFDKGQVDCDLSTFRNCPRTGEDNLATWQARHLGRERLDVDPWLTVEAPWTGRIVCSRSFRYLNDAFPWREIAGKYGSRILFVGTAAEHQAFQGLVGRTIEHAQTSDVMDLARVIKGAALQFANQSLPWWLGAGMGKRVVQETWLQDPNCVIDQEGLTYTRTPEELTALRQWLTAPNGAVSNP